MQNGKLHLFFHSALDDPELWRAALAEQLGELVFSTADNCQAPQTVDVALLWTAPPGGLSAFAHLRAMLGQPLLHQVNAGQEY